MAATDTSAAASRAYFQRLSEMTPSERVKIGVALCAAADALQRAAIRRTYPDASEAEIELRIAVTRLGAELAHRVYRR